MYGPPKPVATRMSGHNSLVASRLSSNAGPRCLLPQIQPARLLHIHINRSRFIIKIFGVCFTFSKSIPSNIAGDWYCFFFTIYIIVINLTFKTLGTLMNITRKLVTIFVLCSTTYFKAFISKSSD